MDDERRDGPGAGCDPVAAQLASYGDWLVERVGVPLRPVHERGRSEEPIDARRPWHLRGLATAAALALVVGGAWVWSLRDGRDGRVITPVAPASDATLAGGTSAGVGPTAAADTSVNTSADTSVNTSAGAPADATLWAPTALPDGWEVLDAATAVRIDDRVRHVQRFALADGSVLDLQVSDGSGITVGEPSGRVHDQSAVVGQPSGGSVTLAWWIESGWQVTTYLHDPPAGPPSTDAVVALLDGLTWRSGEPTAGADAASLGAGTVMVLDAPVAGQRTETWWRIRTPEGVPVSIVIGPLAGTPPTTEPADVPGVGTRWGSMAVLTDGSMAQLRIADLPFASEDDARFATLAAGLRPVGAAEAAAWIAEQRTSLLDWSMSTSLDAELGGQEVQVVIRRPPTFAVSEDASTGVTATMEAVCIRSASTGHEACRIVVTTTGPNGWAPGSAAASLEVDGTWYLVDLRTPTDDTPTDDTSIDVCASDAAGQLSEVLSSGRLTMDDDHQIVVAAIPAGVDRARWCRVGDDGAPDPTGSTVRERPAADSVG